MTRIINITYGWLASIALALGFIVSLVFLVAIIVGGDAGNALSLFGGQVMEGGIIIAAVAVAGGLIWMYLSGDHSLKWEKSSKPTDGSTEDDRE